MLRRSFRVGLTLGLLAGAVAAVVKALQRRPEPVAAPWPPSTPWPPTSAPEAAPEPRVVEPAAPEVPDVDAEPAAPASRERPLRAKPAKAAAKKAAKKAAPVEEAPPTRWVSPDGGICPTTHPVKAKLASRLFHLPGMFAYDRTNPDRCYEDESAAVADGFVRAKR